MVCHGYKELKHVRRNRPNLNAPPSNANVNNVQAQPSQVQAHQAVGFVQMYCAMILARMLMQIK